jgi:hypothetical protein
MNAIVSMACGLANRMFQYSYYLYLKKHGWEVAIDFYENSKLPHEKVDWRHIFPKATFETAPKLDVWLKGGGAYTLSKIRRHYFPWTTRVLEMLTAFQVEIPSKNGLYIMGVFQNAEMVETVKDEVLRIFVFPPFTSGNNFRLMQEMQKNDQSVAIHVRKGKDYLNNTLYQNTCEIEYYIKAINFLKEKLNNPQFYVFTDSPEWVKRNFKFIDYILVEDNPCVGWGNHFDMQLMSYCHHNIISNSTYSWWGAFINQYKNKIVICPKAWFNPKSCLEWNSQSICCKDWISM